MWWLHRDLDDSTSLDDMSFEAVSGAQRGSSNSVNLSVATTDSSSSSGSELSKTKVSMLFAGSDDVCGRAFTVRWDLMMRFMHSWCWDLIWYCSCFYCYISWPDGCIIISRMYKAIISEFFPMGTTPQCRCWGWSQTTNVAFSCWEPFNVQLEGVTTMWWLGVYSVKLICVCFKTVLGLSK